MDITERIRKIRITKGWKQLAVATDMGITQQAYGCLERKADNARLGTLNRYCDAMGIQLHFLVSDIPISEESIKKYSITKQ